MKQPVDFIIIGSGIAGLYLAHQTKPNLTTTPHSSPH